MYLYYFPNFNMIMLFFIILAAFSLLSFSRRKSRIKHATYTFCMSALQPVCDVLATAPIKNSDSVAAIVSLVTLFSSFIEFISPLYLLISDLTSSSSLSNLFLSSLNTFLIRFSICSSSFFDIFDSFSVSIFVSFTLY